MQLGRYVIKLFIFQNILSELFSCISAWYVCLIGTSMFCSVLMSHFPIMHETSTDFFFFIDDRSLIKINTTVSASVFLRHRQDTFHYISPFFSLFFSSYSLPSFSTSSPWIFSFQRANTQLKKMIELFKSLIRCS